MLTDGIGRLKLNWWDHAPNFGDLLSPWLAERISGREVVFTPTGEPAYVSIGSIISHVSNDCVVWGTGSFGVEPKAELCPKAEYRAVRGPLTRNKLVTNKIHCPRVYGDPALLVPDYYRPEIEPEYEVGLVLRWSEEKWFSGPSAPGVRKILLKTDDLEGVLDAILSCKRIASSSLHGLILADAYGIPNAWLESGTPLGLEFKYWDYLISVDKVRPSQRLDPSMSTLTAKALIDTLNFDSRPIKLDLDLLRKSSPF